LTALGRDCYVVSGVAGAQLRAGGRKVLGLLNRAPLGALHKEVLFKTMTTITPEFQAIYDTGELLRRDIYNHLSAWPTEQENALRGDMLPDAFRLRAESLRDRAH
jgi:hypothetical protein